MGLNTRSASNGKEAIATWEKWQPDLIWMDMRMPVMDGVAATGAIATRYSDIIIDKFDGQRALNPALTSKL